MASRSRQLALLAELLKTHDPRIAKAFEDAIHDVRRSINLAEVINALVRGDVEGALRWMAIGPGFMAPLDQAITATYLEGGRLAASTVEGQARRAGVTRAVVRFDGRNPRAENWLRGHSSRLVTAINEDTRAGLREVLRAGMEAGRNPRSTALDIIGRVNRLSGNREGGLLGLTSQQMGFVENARAELASGDPARMRAYFKRARRDMRFDRTVAKAIRDGRPVAAADVQRITGRYKDGLLQLRGEVIARTESLASFHAAQYEALNQTVDTGAVRSENVRRVWDSAGDARVRPSHARLDGESVGLGERFSNGLLYPGDQSAGRPAETINCRCVARTRIDFLSNLPA